MWPQRVVHSKHSINALCYDNLLNTGNSRADLNDLINVSDMNPLKPMPRRTAFLSKHSLMY